MSVFNDLSGQKFQHLYVIKFIERKNKTSYYLCKCDCGNEVILSSRAFKNKGQKSCGCGQFSDTNRINLTGQVFGDLTVIEECGRRHSEILWRCKCSCGNIYEVNGYNLRTGKSNNCGCKTNERISKKNTKHGATNTRLYSIYQNMITRCYNPNSESYSYCGGKGIKICDEWLNKDGFINFQNWSINNGYNDNLSIDRINNDKGYKPDNCRWVTMQVQQNNRTNNHMININGECDTMANWARKLDIKYEQLQYFERKNST